MDQRPSTPNSKLDSSIPTLPLGEHQRVIAPLTKLSPGRQLRLAIVRVTIVLATIFTLRYFYWRALYTMNPAARIFFYAFLLAEVFSFVESLLFYFIAWNPTQYARPEPIFGRAVDVLITTYNEPIDILRETVVAAVNMRYPHKTFLLDDGQRLEVKELAEEFNCGYITRSDRSNAKAGNLNNAVAQTAGEFIVTLDADHIALPGLIEEMIGFFADPTIAMVQATQDFYNLDSFQHVVKPKSRFGWQQQELFFSVIQPGKDRFNAAFFCGSPGIIRRTSLEDIGGIATGTITEDMHTSLRMQKKGWRILYYNQTLARGLAPQTFTGFATQWQRWGQGAMQVLRMEKPLRSRELTLAQKLCYVGSFYFYWMSYVKFFFVLTPIISLMLGVFVLVTDPISYANYFLPYFVLNLAGSVLLQGGFRNFLLSERFNLLKMHVLMRTISGLFEKNTLFFVTPKARAAAARASEVLLPLTLLVALSLAVAVGAVRIQEVEFMGYFWWALAVNLAWAVVFFAMMAGLVVKSMQHREQRSKYRFHLQQEVPMRLSFADPQGRTIDLDQYADNLNRTGVSATFDEQISLGTPVQLEFFFPDYSVQLAGKVVHNQTFTENGQTRVASGIQFDEVSPQTQDEISVFLLQEVAPRQSALLHLTHASQVELEIA